MSAATYPDLRDQVVVVTGAARGIGRAVAIGFAEQGCAVVANDLDAESVSDTVDACTRAGAAKSIGVAADVGEAEASRTMIDDVVSHFGQIDVLVSNAGINPVAGFLELSHETWARVQHVNMWGLFHCGQAAAAAMATRKRGSIVVIGSPAAREAYTTQVHYSAAKAGLQMLALGMAWELGPMGIRTNIVHPGWIETELNREYLWENPTALDGILEQIPLRRTGLPADVAGAAVWLCTEQAAYVNGASLTVDGGLVAGRVKT
jgi:NAD(P)-dependent dehydrogenase (short-subunit alcohol dehydrogenase family)